MPPNSATVRSTSTSRSSRLPAWAGTPMAWPPSPRRCSAAASHASDLRLATTTLAPASTKPSASARPMPRVPPVTMTVRPVMSKRRSNEVRSTSSVEHPLREQVPMPRHVLRDRLSRVPDDALDVVGGAVVAVLAVQPRHGRDVLRHMLGKPEADQIGLQVVGRQILAGDRPAECRTVLPGEACDVEHLGPRQLVDVTDPAFRF